MYRMCKCKVNCSIIPYHFICLEGLLELRDQLIMLIMLCCSAHKIYLLCTKLCSRIRIVLNLYTNLQ